MDDIFLKDLHDLARQFQEENTSKQYPQDISGFKKWMADEYNSRESELNASYPEWAGKQDGRTPESVISTLIVHLNRYALRYSEAAIAGSDFTTQDEFIYLINLKAFGQMTKEKLIAVNVQDESDGIQIISRLESNGWIENTEETPYISNVIKISELGTRVLENQMNQIRKATSMVAGDLSHQERIELIKILTKLELYHQSVFNKFEIKDLIQMIK